MIRPVWQDSVFKELEATLAQVIRQVTTIEPKPLQGFKKMWKIN